MRVVPGGADRCHGFSVTTLSRCYKSLCRVINI